MCRERIWCRQTLWSLGTRPTEKMYKISYMQGNNCDHGYKHWCLWWQRTCLQHDDTDTTIMIMMMMMAEIVVIIWWWQWDTVPKWDVTKNIFGDFFKFGWHIQQVLSKTIITLQID